MASEPHNINVLIDWLEFTVLDYSLRDVVEDILGITFDTLTPLEKGRFGYQNQMKWTEGNVFVMFSKESSGDEISAKTRIKDSQGVHVMITGTGCRHYSVNHSLSFLVKLLAALPRVNFSRIDLAIDDYESKIINYGRINDAALAGYFTSRWSKWDELNSRQTSTNQYIGRTMYFGSQASDLFCRIYDKTLERKANNSEEVEGEWTRLEMVYRKDRARKLVDYLIHDEVPIGKVLKGTLKQYIRFLTPTQDSNKSRWPTVKWWEELLQDVEKLQLTIKKETKSIEDMTSWVDRQIAPTMAAIITAKEGDFDWLRKIIVKGSNRLTRRHKDAISLYQKGQMAYE